MKVEDLVKNYKDLPSHRFKQKLNELVRSNYRYANLNQKNRKVITDIVKKYSGRIRDGRGISYDTIRRECYSLHQKRIKLGLTEEDLKDIKEILGMFKR
jgi:hypothetical protein